MVINQNIATPEQKENMLKYAEIHGVKKAADKFGCTERTIYRWKKQYDGTLKSLEVKIERKDMVHPNALKEFEVDVIKKCVEENPYITDKEIIEIMGTNRNRTVIRKYRDRIFGKSNYGNKSLPETMFNKQSVEEINKKDISLELKEKLAFLIEVNNLGIYLSRDKGDGYPASLTRYFNMALKFQSKNEAEDFIKKINNTSGLKLTIKEIKK